MDKSELLNYIVPIYQEKEFIGTGFFVENYLITAAHVIDKLMLIDGKILFKFDEKNQIIGNNDLIFYKKDFLPEGYCDIAVFNQDEIKSPIEFACNLDFSSKTTYMGYSYDEQLNLLRTDIHEIPRIKDMAFYYLEIGGPKIKLDNCFISKPSVCKGGNSGGPLFQNDKVVGMLIQSLEIHNKMVEDRYLNSMYITDILNNLKP